MTNEEYNDRLFSLIQRNAEWQNVPTFDHQNAAKSVGIWCKALMDAYISLRQKTVPPLTGPRDAPQVTPMTHCAGVSCLNACLAYTEKVIASQGWHHIDGIWYCPDCWKMTQPAPTPDPDCDSTLEFDRVASIVRMELKEFLERAETSSLSESDKTLFAFLLTCIEPPLPAQRDPLEDF